MKQLFHKKIKESDAAEGYDIWAEKYDEQPDNLMLALDELIFPELLNEIDVAGKTIVDVGCGTGRHWKKILDMQPSQLVGYDVSKGMLDKLQQKFPQARTHLLVADKLARTTNESADIIISTLTIAHIKNASSAMKEWDSVLKPGGYIIITDYHPAILQHGGQRTFKHEGKIIAVRNYVHTVEKIGQISGQLGWNLIRLTERHIDEWAKPFYEKQQALSVYEKYKGMPVIYGMLFKKEK